MPERLTDERLRELATDPYVCTDETTRQIAAELLVLKSYALTTLAITPMALLLTGLAGHLTPAVTISRIGDTLIGVLIGIVIAALTIERADRYHRS